MEDNVELLLANYSPEVQDLARQVRRLVLEVMPEAVECVDPPDHLVTYGFGTRMNDIVFVLMPVKAGVNLGFYRGATLEDPHSLLSGTGKRHRHARLESAAEAGSPALRQLMDSALARARDSRKERQ
jgi:hypothetical protein